MGETWLSIDIFFKSCLSFCITYYLEYSKIWNIAKSNKSELQKGLLQSFCVFNCIFITVLAPFWLITPHITFSFCVWFWPVVTAKKMIKKSDFVTFLTEITYLKRERKKRMRNQLPLTCCGAQHQQLGIKIERIVGAW